MDDAVHEVVSLVDSGDRELVLQALTTRWQRGEVHVVRGRCVELLEAGPGNTRSLLRALDLLDEVLDQPR